MGAGFFPRHFLLCGLRWRGTSFRHCDMSQFVVPPVGTGVSSARVGAAAPRPGVWHTFRLLYPNRPIQTLALFAKPRRVLEYVSAEGTGYRIGSSEASIACRFLRCPHNQPQPIQALQASHNRHACFLFAILSAMIDVSSFAGASQNAKCGAPRRFMPDVQLSFSRVEPIVIHFNMELDHPHGK